MGMEAVNANSLTWCVSGVSGMGLSGFDERGNHVAEIECKGKGLWRFSFNDYSGGGTIRVGPGCNYNPLHMVETMREFLIEGREHRLVTYEDEMVWDEDFQGEWS